MASQPSSEESQVGHPNAVSPIEDEAQPTATSPCITLQKRAPTFLLRRELDAIEFVRNCTSVPIPVVSHFRLSPYNAEPGWISMERIPGGQLGDVWPTMTETAKAKTIHELRSYMGQLASIRPSNPGWIGSCNAGPAYDPRLSRVSTCGPFLSVAQFHDFLVEPLYQCHHSPESVADYRNRLPDSHAITFAHAGISWQTIIVDPETGAVTGIVGWEMAGFWPEWWEYRKAVRGCHHLQWWIDIVKQILHEYHLESDTDVELGMSR